MAIRKYKPYTPSMRFTQTNANSEVTKSTPEKSLTVGIGKTGGRNHHGRTTMWTKAGGHKRRYRIIDSKRHTKADIPAKVASIEYDPNRTAHIALLHYADGEKRYILAPLGIEVGSTVIAGDKVDVKKGNALPMRNMPVGTIIHAVEMKPGKGAQVCRGAGTGAQIMGKDDVHVMLRLPSSEMRYFPADCYATVGQVGNLDHNKVKVGKAGRSRWMGVRPSVRGMAMNPVDHPHGGGEGRGKGNHPQTPWGKPTKGYKTRQPKKRSNRMIVRRKNRQVLR